MIILYPRGPSPLGSCLYIFMWHSEIYYRYLNKRRPIWAWLKLYLISNWYNISFWIRTIIVISVMASSSTNSSFFLPFFFLFGSKCSTRNWFCLSDKRFYFYYLICVKVLVSLQLYVVLTARSKDGFSCIFALTPSRVLPETSGGGVRTMTLSNLPLILTWIEDKNITTSSLDVHEFTV